MNFDLISESEVMSYKKMLVNGKLIESTTGECFNVSNPATGKIVATYINATAEDIDVAASVATQGFRAWSRTPTSKRAEILHRAAELIRQRTEELARTITQEIGKPMKEARSEVIGASELLYYFAEEGLRISGDVPQMDLPNELPLIIRQPIGVVGAITPFNAPVTLLSWKLGPALMAGCSVVAKPDEHAPTGALILAQIFLEAGLPCNVFQVVIGGAKTGNALVSHPLIRKIAFTGSVEVGQIIGSIAAKSGKRVTLELGGQCPAIITDGANLDGLVPDFVKQAFNNAGQYCYRINRAYVQETIYDDFMDRLLTHIKKIKVGPGDDETVTMGPLCNEDVYNSTLKHISDAVSKGGKICYGGKRLTGPDFDAGFFFMPTVIDDTNHNMLVMQEETFGPVVGIQKISSLREGINLANDTRYGLAAYVFTGDAGIGLQAAREIEAGSVWVNKMQRAYYLLPFGGVKQSGQGRAKSKYGFDEYLELKAVYLALPDIG